MKTQSTFRIMHSTGHAGFRSTREVFRTDDRQEAKDVFESMFNDIRTRIGSFCERREQADLEANANDELDIITLDEFYADYGTTSETTWLEEEIL